jgi:hypothetical protein
MTRAGLVKFQAAQGVTQTGEFDAATRAKAHALTCKVPNTIKTANPVKKEEKKEDKEQEREQSDDVTAITTTASGSAVTWTVNGYSKQGFKVVWSKNANPTYPTRDGD